MPNKVYLIKCKCSFKNKAMSIGSSIFIVNAIFGKFTLNAVIQIIAPTTTSITWSQTWKIPCTVSSE